MGMTRVDGQVMLYVSRRSLRAVAPRTARLQLALLGALAALP